MLALVFCFFAKVLIMTTITDLLENSGQLLDPSQNKFLLANKTWPQVEDYLKSKDSVILPIGSTEQHGPDGLLGIDHLTATGLAYALGPLTETLVAPPLNYGMAMHHLGFAGTMALRPTTYINVIADLLSSLQRHGFKKIFVINGHGGNKGPFLNAMQEREDQFKDLEVRFINWWVMPGLQKNIIDKYFGEDEGYHATPTEISVTMALEPGLMAMPASYKCPQKEVSGPDCTWVMPAKFRELYPDGVMRANHSNASEEIGREAIKYAIEEIAEIISQG